MVVESQIGNVYPEVTLSFPYYNFLFSFPVCTKKILISSSCVINDHSKHHTWSKVTYTPIPHIQGRGKTQITPVVGSSPCPWNKGHFYFYILLLYCAKNL